MCLPQSKPKKIIPAPPPPPAPEPLAKVVKTTRAKSKNKLKKSGTDSLRIPLTTNVNTSGASGLNIPS